jgi:mitochondrial intermembrane space import and assembly protein 40
MQECFREHPDIYGAELEGDEEEEEGGDRSGPVDKEGDKPETVLLKDERPQSSKGDTDTPVAPLESPGDTEKAKAK